MTDLSNVSNSVERAVRQHFSRNDATFCRLSNGRAGFVYTLSRTKAFDRSTTPGIRDSHARFTVEHPRSTAFDTFDKGAMMIDIVNRPTHRSIPAHEGFKVRVPDGCDRCSLDAPLGYGRGLIRDYGSGAMLRCAACGQTMRDFGRWIYFIQASTDEIKIGSALDLIKRITQLQVGHPYAFQVRALLFAPLKVERDLHREFDEFRIRGEWFWESNSLRTFMRERCMPVNAPFPEFAAIVKGL